MGSGFILFICLALIVNLASGNSYVLHEARDHEIPHAWIKREAAAAGLVLPVRVGIRQSSLDAGAQLLMEISDPYSPKYGQHLSATEVHDFFAPSTDTVEQIISWIQQELSDRKVSQSINKQWIQLEATVEELETLLKTRYHIWEYSPSGRQTIACDDYSIPRHLSEYIDYITPGIKLHLSDSPTVSSEARQEPRSEQAGSINQDSQQSMPSRDARLPPIELQTSQGYKKCPQQVTPQCIQKMYNVTGNVTAIKGNDLGIYGTSLDRYQPAALEAFFENLAPYIPKTTKPTELFVDSNDYKVHPYGGELQLDLEVAYPLVYPQNITVWYVDDEHYQTRQFTIDNSTHAWTRYGIFNTWLDALDGSYCNYTAFGITGDTPGIDDAYPDKTPDGGYDHPLQCGVYKPTPVMSISFGHAESWLPVRYLQRQCSKYMKLGLQGISIFFASGDFGAGGSYGNPYPKSQNRCRGPGKPAASPRNIFPPTFPASCPFVTAVGATQLDQVSSSNEFLETAANFSGGGFSNIWTQPDYQKNAVSTFLDKYPPSFPSYAAENGSNIGSYGGRFNRIGRGYPDVAAVGKNILVTLEIAKNETFFIVDFGTSASAPLWASLITRINAARLKSGKKAVGFVNPVLYAHPEAFHDITEGRTCGCNPEVNNGYSTAPGWDPATGLGSPDFPKLMEVFMALP